MVPDTRYARSGDLRVAYQVIGSGPLISSSCRASSPTSTPSGMIQSPRASSDGWHHFPGSSSSTRGVPASRTGLAAFPPLRAQG